MRTRRRRVIAAAVPLVLLLAVLSFLLARFLTTENRERDAIAELLDTEATGGDVVALLHGCDPGCRAAVARFAPRLRGPGEVKIARLDSPTAYTLGRTEGWSRVVWVRGDRPPLVQCVQVRRQGGPLTERSVTLLALRAPLADNEDSC